MLDLGALPAGRIDDIEAMDSSGTGSNTLVLNQARLLRLSSSSDSLRVDGNRGDVMHVTDLSDWSRTSDVAARGQTYARYEKGQASLLIDTDVTLQFSLNLGTLSGRNGFKIAGQAANHHFGRTLAAAGDVNADGYADIKFGAKYGGTHVVFGKPSGFSANFDLASLDSSNTLRVDGDAGDSLTSTGQAWIADAMVTLDATEYQSYVSGAATLLVDIDITATVTRVSRSSKLADIAR